MPVIRATPPRYTTVHISEWTQRDFFEREVDWFCRGAGVIRYRSCEWVQFTERFVPHCEDWNGCWVAETAWQEFSLYLSLPEGEYHPLDYPMGYSFHKDDPMFDKTKHSM